MNYTDLVTHILKNMGGANNIKKVWHCATRLRFSVFDNDKVDKPSLEKLDGIIQVIYARDQWQIVIGTQVADVYSEFIKLDEMKNSNVQTENEKENKDKKGGLLGILNGFIAFISSLFMPFLDAICGAGVLKGILALASTMGWMDAKDGAYIILNAASDALFYFLPLFIAYNAAKQLKVDRFVSMTIAGALVYPQITQLATDNTTLSFFGVPVVPMSYTSSVIPIILAIWILSYLEPLLKKIIPNSLKYVFVALLELVIMVPATLIIVGPIGSSISNALADSIISVYNIAPAVAGVVIGGLWQVIVMFGFHWMILPLIMSNIASLGHDPIFAIACAAVLSQAGAALGVFFKTKDKKMRQVSGAASIAAIFGITEPALYGVTLKYKKPFYIAISVSAIGGIVIGLSGAQAYAFAFPSILSIPTYLGKGFVWEIVSLIFSFFGAAILTYLFGLSGVKEADENPLDIEYYRIPVEGEKIDLKEVNDPLFSSGTIGQGIAIKPNSDEIVAPIDGEVTATFDTGHAIGITDNFGSQVLIHVGIDTVNLKGTYFKNLVKKGQIVKQGQKLIEFDHLAIEKAGYDTTVMMIITNSSEYKIETNLDNTDINALSLGKI